MEALSADLVLHIASFLKNQNHLLNFKLSYKFVNINMHIITCNKIIKYNKIIFFLFNNNGNNIKLIIDYIVLL